MKMKAYTVSLAFAVLALPMVSLNAQNTTPRQRHTINGRDARQQARIDKGVADGQITPKGAAAADAHQEKLNEEQANMRAATGGGLTSADRHKSARQQNRTSQRIYNRNHNAVTDPGVSPK